MHLRWGNAGSELGAGRPQAPLGWPCSGVGQVAAQTNPSPRASASGLRAFSGENLMRFFAQSGATIGAILPVMAVVAWIETVIPLHRGARSSLAHLGPNRALTSITFATNIFLNVARDSCLLAVPPCPPP